MNKRAKLNWTARMFPVIDFSSKHTFTAQNWKPEDYFQKYLPENLLDNFAKFTNMYFEQQNPGKFLNTTSEEISNLLGCQIYMSSMGLRRIKYYWKPSFQCDFVKSIMPFNRFSQLRNNLHVVDVINDKNDDDKFWKVRPILNHVKNICNSLDKDFKLAVDEQMIGFKSTHMPSRQYLPKKPTKYGLKIFVLAGPTGIVFDFLLYQGFSTALDTKLVEMFGVTGAIVLTLLSGVPQNNSTVIYMNRYFTSVELFLELRKRSIYATGPILDNRLGTVDFGETKRTFQAEPRGSFRELVSSNNKICLVRWLDSKPITFVSTCSGSTPIYQAKRFSKKKETIFVDLPYVISDYNKHMGGVDLCDQMLAYYQPPRTCKWTVRVIFHIIDLAITNAWNEYREEAKSSNISEILDLFGFRLHLAEILCLKKSALSRGRPRKSFPCSSKQKVQPSVVKRFDGFDHLPSFDEKRDWASRCAYKNCDARSKIFCTKCNVASCVRKGKNCFVKYHSKEAGDDEVFSSSSSESE